MTSTNSTSSIRRLTVVDTISNQPTGAHWNRPRRLAILHPHRLMETLITTVPISLPVPSSVLTPKSLSKLNTAVMADLSPDLDDPDLDPLMVVDLVGMGLKMSLVMGGLNMDNPNRVMDGSRSLNDPDRNLNLDMAENLNLSGRLLRSLDLGMAGDPNTNSHIHRNSDLIMDGDQNLSSLRRLNLDLGMAGDPSMGKTDPTMELDMAGNPSMGNTDQSTELDMAGNPSTGNMDLSTELDMAGNLSMENRNPSTELNMAENKSMENMDPNMGGNPGMGSPNLNTGLGMDGRQSMREVGLDMDERMRTNMGRVMEIGRRPDMGPGMGRSRAMAVRDMERRGVSMRGNLVMGDRRKRKEGIGIPLMAVKKAMAARNMGMTTLMMMMRRRSITALGTTITGAMMMMMSNQTGGHSVNGVHAIIATK